MQYSLKYKDCTHAASVGDLVACKQLLERSHPLTQKAALAAIQHGHTHCLEYFLTMKDKWYSHYTCLFASVFYNRIDCLKLLIPLHSDIESILTKYLEIAAAVGHIDILQFGVQNNIPFSQECANMAARYGRLDSLRYIIQYGGHVDETTYITAYKYQFVPENWTTTYNQWL